jgi:DNA-binding SARP family transcriptional activator
MMHTAPGKKLECAADRWFHPAGMRFGVLGPLSLSKDGEAVPLGGRQQRTLLAVLLLHANEAVPRAQLVEALWEEQPPPSWAESLDSYLYRLRKLLGHNRLERKAGGYLLHVEPGELDADEFERLVASAGAAAENADYAAALGELTVALALCRGPAWGDLLDGGALEPDAQRLDELRLSVLESRFEAELALGHGAELVPELEQLVAEHPLWERLIASLMLALYRAGRQTDALGAFQTARRRLIDELGLEPGPELHELQRRILEHDPTLGAPRRLAPLSGPRRARLLAVAALGALAALVAGVLVLAGGATRRPPSLASGVSGIVGVDAASDRLVDATPLVGVPGAVAAAGGSLWWQIPWRIGSTKRTVTFHFAEPDPEFLYQLTEFAFSAPIPPGTTDREPGERTVPGTGPYKIVSNSPAEIRFVRNPYFHEWSHAAQPAGNPNEIVWQSAPSLQAAVTAIEQGRADWLEGSPAYAQYHQLELQDPGQLHNNPQWAGAFLPLNIHNPPFNDLRVRQALSYAINRAKLAQSYGGPALASPSCQAIVPGIPGYRRYCPYTLHPLANGTWSAPDMARARQLVAQSKTIGERIDLIHTPNAFTPTATSGYIAGVLRALGYRVRVSVIPYASITPAMWNSFQIQAAGNWIPAYPDPSSYVPAFFSCRGSNSNDYYCNPAIDREMRHAELLELTDPPAADALWERVDRQLTNNAEWVTIVASREVEITSARLHNYEYNPVWGFLADQAWVH